MPRPRQAEWFLPFSSSEDQRPSADVSDMVSFGAVEDKLLDDSMSLIASDIEDMSGSTADSQGTGSFH